MQDYKIQHNERVAEKMTSLFDKYKCVKKASAAFVKSLDGKTLERLEALVSETTYSIRRYGRSSFFCWAEHRVLTERGCDPWPASRYPKAVLIVDFAIKTDIVS